MSSNLYTTKTASLKATKADIKSINAQRMTLNGKTIPDIIDEKMIRVKVSSENMTGLTTVTKDGIVSLSEEKFELVHPTEEAYNNIHVNGRTFSAFKDVVLVKDGECLGENGELLLNFDTTKINSLYSDIAWGNPYDYPNNSDTQNITRIFPHVIEWYGDMTSLEKIRTTYEMYPSDRQVQKTYNSNNYWFGSGLQTFVGDLSSLKNGSTLFGNTNLETFIGDLSSLENGGDIDANGKYQSLGMFGNTNLSLESVEYIADTIQDLSGKSTGSIIISWKSLPADESLRLQLTKALNEIVKKNWIVGTNEELVTIATNSQYQISNLTTTSGFVKFGDCKTGRIVEY